MVDLEVVLVFDFYDVDAVLVSLLSGVASAISSRDSISKYVDNENIW